MPKKSTWQRQRERREQLRAQTEFWEEQARRHAGATARIGRLQQMMDRAGRTLDAEFDRN